MNNKMQNDRPLSIGGLRRRKGFCRFLASVAAAMFLFVSTAPAFADPTSVLGGNAILTGMHRATLDSNGANAAAFSSSSASAVLDWSKFNIGSGQSMSFNGASTTFFNLVDGAAGKSQIDGIINGSGNVWVINPAGIAFGAGSSVNVGGLFAAAAASVENSNDLRNGTASLPVLGKMSGSIELGGEEGPTRFSGERCLMLANKIQAGKADFSEVDRTTLEGVGYVTLESLEGGLINIKPSDFRLDDTGVILGDVQASGLFQALANGDMTINGDVSVAGAVILKSACGDITVSEGASVSIQGEGCGLEMSAGHLTDDYLANLQLDENGKSGVVGNVNIHGKVTLDGDFAELYIRAGEGVGSKGDLTLDGEVSAKGNDNWVDLRSGYGYSSEGGIELSGKFSVEGNGNVGVVVAGNGDYANGNLHVTGDVSVKGDGCTLELDAANGWSSHGNVEIDGSVSLDGDFGQIAMFTGAGAMADGNVNIGPDAEIAAHGKENLLRVMTGYGNGSRGVSRLQGLICVDEGSRIVSYSGYGVESEGEISVNGVVKAEGDGGSVGLYAGWGDGSNGSVELEADGCVTANGSEGFVEFGTSAGAGAEGNVKIAGCVSADGANGEVVVGTGYGVGAQGDIFISPVARITANGDHQVTEGVPRQAVMIGAAIGEGAVGSVSVEGEISADGEHGFLSVGAGIGERAVGDIALTGNVHANGDSGRIEISSGSGVSSSGVINMAGLATADGREGEVRLFSGYGDGAKGLVSIGESAVLSGNGHEGGALIVAGLGEGASSDVAMGGTMTATGEGGIVGVVAGYGTGAKGDVTISGDMVADKETQVRTSDGNIRIGGRLSSDDHVAVWAVGDGQRTGNVMLSGVDNVSAAKTVTIVASGDVLQDGGNIQTGKGYAERKSVPAAVSGETVNVNVDGSVGDSSKGYLWIDGKMYGVIGGDAAIGAAEGKNFQGGDMRFAPTEQVIASVSSSVMGIDKEGMTKSESVIIDDLTSDFGVLGGSSSSLLVGGDLSIYTAGKLEANGLLKADGDLTISASSFGDMSYLQAGGTLTVNNVGKPAHPQIAYFESVNGREPRINNLPNDVVIFVDGRLAGGNLQIINKFGATEAFPVSTPELKSEQGIFGNPVFLHGDLDVANPMAVGNVDYMLQEIPRLTLASDFPLEIDKSVNTAGLNPKDVYRFGQHAQVAEEKPQAEQDEKKDDKASAEKSAEPKVAMR